MKRGFERLLYHPLNNCNRRRQLSSGIKHQQPKSKSKLELRTKDFPCLDRARDRDEQLVAQQSQLDETKSSSCANNPAASQSTALADGSGPEPVYSSTTDGGYELFRYQQPFHLQYGGQLPGGFQLAYESWGELSPARDNVILLHTGLSASSHARSTDANGKPGWWEQFIGPGRPLDTDKFHIVCANVLGGCYGSTGPSSPMAIAVSGEDSSDKEDHEPFATRFPVVSVFDMVRAQFLLLNHLGVRRLHASVGSSMGGMQSLAACALFPERVDRCVSISACARSHPYSIALRFAQRAVLMNDPHWHQGFYQPQFGPLDSEEMRLANLARPDRLPPHRGMKLARLIATVGYRSGPEWEKRFGRRRVNSALPEESEQLSKWQRLTDNPQFCPEFLIESYLDHQYDANSMLYISKAMDLFDMSLSPAQLAESQGVDYTKQIPPLPPAEPLPSVAMEPDDNPPASLITGLSRVRCPTLVLGVQSDILFPVAQQKEIATCLRLNPSSHRPSVTYYELDSIYGHDTFLMDLQNVGAAIKGHLDT